MKKSTIKKSTIKKSRVTVLVGLLAGAATLALTTTGASAYIACNRLGDCWHTETRYAPPGVRFDYHPDDWYFHQHWDRHTRFRDYHEGRGYYRNGVWITF